MRHTVHLRLMNNIDLQLMCMQIAYGNVDLAARLSVRVLQDLVVILHEGARDVLANAAEAAHSA